MEEGASNDVELVRSPLGESGADSVVSEAVEEVPAVQSAPAPGVRMRGLAAGQVGRIVYAALPDGMHLSKDARVALQKSATFFLMYLSCLAEDERSRESKKRVTLSEQDIMLALKAAGMGHLLPLLGDTCHVKRPRKDDDGSPV